MKWQLHRLLSEKKRHYVAVIGEAGRAHLSKIVSRQLWHALKFIDTVPSRHDRDAATAVLVIESR
jgi:hypothetical protein